MYSSIHGLQILLKVNIYQANGSRANELKVQYEMVTKHYGTEQVPRCETALAWHCVILDQSAPVTCKYRLKLYNHAIPMLSLILEWQFIKWSHQEYRYWIFVGINIMFNESADVWLHTPIRSFYTRHAKIIIRIIYYPMDQKSKTHSLLFFSFPFWTRILTCICHCLSHRSRQTNWLHIILSPVSDV